MNGNAGRFEVLHYYQAVRVIISLNGKKISHTSGLEERMYLRSKSYLFVCSVLFKRHEIRWIANTESVLRRGETRDGE